MPRARRDPVGRGRIAAAAIARARSDRSLGAREIAAALLDDLARELARWGRSRSEATERRVAGRIARELATVQPAMGMFRQWGEEWSSIRRTAPAGSLARELRRWRSIEARGLRLELSRTSRVVAKRLPGGLRLLTISRGSTVLEALRSLPIVRRPREIVVLESRPGGEGRRTAADLRHAGLSARWVRDASRDEAVRRADLVMIGADTIEPGGTVVHKVGTLPLARVASREGIPLIVVAARSKWTDRGRRRLSALFDRTPSRFVSEYWTDRGVRAGGRRGSRGVRHQREMDRPTSAYRPGLWPAGRHVRE